MEQLNQPYKILRSLLQEYAPPLSVKVDEPKRYELWSEKNVVIEGRKMKEIFFASVISQSNYVGFYFMPVYTDSEITEVFTPSLLKILKGKSCFHIKAIDADLINDIKSALRVGFKKYKEHGWI